MTRPHINPFIYGKPVPTGRFIGRKDSVNTLFSRMYNGESAAIVGEPHVGKSSLLNYIADETTRAEWIADTFPHYHFISVDTHLFGGDLEPEGFWKHVVESIQQGIPGMEDEKLKNQCNLVAQSNYGTFVLEQLFRLMGAQKRRAVILVDEFDALLNHSRLNQAEFFGALRSLATRTEGLVMIVASRLSLSVLNKIGQRNNPYGSPFFNNLAEVKLQHLTNDEAAQLIDRTLLEAGGSSEAVQFSASDRKFLSMLAGNQPFLLQLAAAILFDALAQAKPEQSVYEVVEERFHLQAKSHFEDMERTLQANDLESVQRDQSFDQVVIRQNLVRSFDLEELETLCSDIGVDLEEVGGDGKSAKALKLISYCNRRGLLDELTSKCRELRPDVAW